MRLNPRTRNGFNGRVVNFFSHPLPNKTWFKWSAAQKELDPPIKVSRSLRYASNSSPLWLWCHTSRIPIACISGEFQGVFASKMVSKYRTLLLPVQKSFAIIAEANHKKGNTVLWLCLWFAWRIHFEQRSWNGWEVSPLLAWLVWLGFALILYVVTF